MNSSGKSLNRPQQKATFSPSSHILAVGGGKGGTGKSFFSYLLGKHLLRRGYRTLLIDGDLGCANLHTVAGAKPVHTLSDFLLRKVPLEKLITATSSEGLFLLSGAGDSLSITNLSYTAKQKLLKHISKLSFDIIIIDVGSGTAPNTLDLFLLASHKFLLLNPDMVSIENGYRFLKSALLRKFALSVGGRKAHKLLKEKITEPFSSVSEMYRYLLEKDKSVSKDLRDAFNDIDYFLVMNKTLEESDASGKRFEELTEKYLTSKINSLGNLPFSMEVVKAYQKGEDVSILPEIDNAMEKIVRHFIPFLK